MIHFKKLVSILVVILVGWISKAYAVTVWVLRGTKDTAGDTSFAYNQIDWKRSLLGMISLVNEYLWFSVWFFCFLFMIINGYKLITANWDEGETKKATKALLWSVIWITICLLAYIIVRLAVNLFA